MIRKCGAVFVLGLSICGCRQDASVGPSVAGKRGDVLGGLDQAYTLDQRFEQLARVVPGFAGVGFDENHVLVVHLTAIGSALQAAAPVEALLKSLGRDDAAALVSSMTVQPATYDFLQLAQWRRAILRYPDVRGITKSDVDERNNKINLAGSDAGTVAELTAIARELKIPDSAITINVEPPVIPDAQLTDTYRPMYASLHIYLGGGNECTMWALALLEDINQHVDSTDVYAITNSHCTDSVGVVTGQIFCQNDCTVREGYEVADPARWVYPNDPFIGSQSSCLSGYKCRYSDAALFKIDSASIWHGTMGVTCTGLTLCDSYTIKNTITPLYGDDVRTVGAASGYRAGYVQNTCVDRVQGGTNTDLLCQYEADYHSESGDSGKPVVTLCPTCSGYNPVELEGINWGHNPSYAMFSPATMVSNELAHAMGAAFLFFSR